MKEKKQNTFVKVKYDLLASTQLNSTQKLFISYIIGWQENKKVCKETNNNLAIIFGMKYGGIRNLISSLNKFDFFKSERFGFDKNSSSSGHQITVDINKLQTYLCSENPSKETISTEPESIEDFNLDDLKISDSNEAELELIPQSKDEIISDFNNNNSTLEINPIQQVQNDEKYDIEIDAFKDTIRSEYVIESFVEQLNGTEPNYIKAKVIFEENDFFIDDVVLATENNVKPKYINRFDIENEIKKRNKDREILP